MWAESSKHGVGKSGKGVAKAAYTARPRQHRHPQGLHYTESQNGGYWANVRRQPLPCHTDEHLHMYSPDIVARYVRPSYVLLARGLDERRVWNCHTGDMAETQVKHVAQDAGL